MSDIHNTNTYTYTWLHTTHTCYTTHTQHKSSVTQDTESHNSNWSIVQFVKSKDIKFIVIEKHLMHIK